MTTPSTELTIIPGIEANKLALITPESAHAVKAAYLPHFTAFLALEKQAAEIAVNSPKLARIMRLDLRKVRIAAEKARKDLGTEAKNYKEAVDQVYNLLEDRLKPVEQRMESIEKAEEIAAKERAEALKTARVAELTPFATIIGADILFYDLANMPESQYQAMLQDHRGRAEAKIVADKKAEENKIAAEAARVKREQELAAENARLAKEAAERQKALDAERAKAEETRRKAAAEVERVRKENEAKLEAERKKAAEEAARIKRVADEKAAKERAEREVKEKAEQAKRDAEAKKLADERAATETRLRREKEASEREAKRLFDEAKAREDAENAKKAQEAEEAAKAAKAPDKAKLLSFAKMVRNLEQVNPVLTTPAGTKLRTTITQQVEKFAKWVESEANKL